MLIKLMKNGYELLMLFYVICVQLAWANRTLRDESGVNFLMCPPVELRASCR